MKKEILGFNVNLVGVACDYEIYECVDKQYTDKHFIVYPNGYEVVVYKSETLLPSGVRVNVYQTSTANEESTVFVLVKGKMFVFNNMFTIGWVSVCKGLFENSLLVRDQINPTRHIVINYL